MIDFLSCYILFFIFLVLYSFTAPQHSNQRLWAMWKKITTTTKKFNIKNSEKKNITKIMLHKVSILCNFSYSTSLCIFHFSTAQKKIITYNSIESLNHFSGFNSNYLFLLSFLALLIFFFLCCLLLQQIYMNESDVK